MRVLVVDDTRFMRGIIRSILEGVGLEVCGEAGNGIEAVDQYAKLSPDLVIMDVIMPEKSGIEALCEIKKYDKNSKIIMCTAMGQEEYVKKAAKNGALDYVVKPFDHSHLRESVLRLI